MKAISRFPLALALALCLALPGLARAQDSPPLSAGQLEQLVAPVALYPDSLLAQVLMASTYPLEVVQAARWAKDNPNLKDKALDDALQQQPWDASVKSVVAFPQVLQMMNEKLDWTEQLGDAFLAQQKDVMDAVQRLRTKAQAAGNLNSGKEQTVRTEAGSGGSPQTIIIEPAETNTVYVPVYNPTVVYGPWAYPAYPPYYWYPPGYVATSVISFGLGVAAGYALWGDWDWHHGDINVDINDYRHFTRNDWHGDHNWRHDPEHRKGVPYRNDRVEKQFRGDGHGFSRDQARAQARRDFRGHDGSGFDGRDGIRDGRQIGQRDGQRMGQHAGQRDGQRIGQHGGQRDQALAGHDFGGGHNRNAFQGMNRGDYAYGDRARGAGSRQVMQNHPRGGGFNSFHGGGGHFRGGGGHLRRN